jgi:hypothetical protein
MCWPAYTAEAQAEHAAADSFKVSSAMRVLQARVTSIYCILMHISVQHCSGYVFTALQLPLHGSGIGDAICHRLCVSCTQRAASTLTHTQGVVLLWLRPVRASTLLRRDQRAASINAAQLYVLLDANGGSQQTIITLK